MTSARPYIPRPGERAPVAPRFKQGRGAQLRVWWREIDHVLLALVVALMALGSIAVAAASPASARARRTSRGVYSTTNRSVSSLVRIETSGRVLRLRNSSTPVTWPSWSIIGTMSMERRR